MVEDQVLKLCTSILLESLNQKEPEPSVQMVEVVELSEPVGSTQAQVKNDDFARPVPVDMSDSFLSSSNAISEPSLQGHGYDYSPTYQIVVDERQPQFASKPVDYYVESDDTGVYDDESIGHNIDMYSIDNAKMRSKMDDVGISPYKTKKYQPESHTYKDDPYADNRSRQQHHDQNEKYRSFEPEEYESSNMSDSYIADAICSHCNEFVNAKNVEYHSQYCVGNQPRYDQRGSTNSDDHDLQLLKELDTDTIPRVNQRLYKVHKALKSKEIECLDKKSSKLVQSLQLLCKSLMTNNIELDKLERTGSKLKSIGKFNDILKLLFSGENKL